MCSKQCSGSIPQQQWLGKKKLGTGGALSERRHARGRQSTRRVSVRNRAPVASASRMNTPMPVGSAWSSEAMLANYMCAAKAPTPPVQKARAGVMADKTGIVFAHARSVRNVVGVRGSV